jgi:hypothetical protein
VHALSIENACGLDDAKARRFWLVGRGDQIACWRMFWRRFITAA